MQSQTVMKTSSIKVAHQPLLDNGWTPSASEIGSSVGSLDDALSALTEAEQLIRSQAEHIRHLESLAMTDELTGLMNRRGFTMSLQRELSLARRDTGANGVLIMADLDGFKAINDTWGHKVGDDYLKAVAHALIASVRSSDIVARLGGDEFAILFTRMNEADGATRLATLERSFNDKFMKFGDKILPLRASFGMSGYVGNDTPESIMATADLKLYAHKAIRGGRA